MPYRPVPKSVYNPSTRQFYTQTQYEYKSRSTPPKRQGDRPNAASLGDGCAMLFLIGLAITFFSVLAGTVHSPSLLSGGQLDSCDSLSSPNGRFVLSMQCDGNLVLIAPGDHPIWATNTGQFSGSVLQMQGDGNVVVYSSDHVARWASGTSGHPGSVLAVQNDGNVVVIAPGDHPIWATNTSGPTSRAGDTRSG
jgi:hypothetical protein